MKKARHLYYDLVVSVFEKYGFETIICPDYKTLYVSKHPDCMASVPFTAIEEIFLREELDEFIDDISPIHLSSWKIVVI